ncbi:MAG TPA: OmpA family protein [Gemmatimonadaceae bacterium]|nr:OmpA family protein [Gemmatimonadaceae bacterium]
MHKQVKTAVAAALVLPLAAACATKGALRRAVTDQRTALEQERTARTAADSAAAADLQTVRNDVETVRNDLQALRNELQALRTEFGAKITAVESGLQFAFPVNFAFDDATVREGDIAALDRFAQVAQRYYGASKITVEGFADPAGSAAYNRRLSQRRAQAVREYLVQRGMSTNEIEAIGYGESRQVIRGAERDEPGAELNRRVVFVIESRGQQGVALLPEGR